MLDRDGSSDPSDLPVRSLFTEIGLPTGIDRRRRLIGGDPIASLDLPEDFLVLLLAACCICVDSVVGVATFT